MKRIIIILVVFVSLFACYNSALASYSFDRSSGLDVANMEAGYSTSIKAKGEPLAYFIGMVINALLSFIGVVFLLLMIYGGYIWMLARGNEQEVEKAKNIVKNAIIGIAVVLSAYAITFFVTSQFTP